MWQVDLLVEYLIVWPLSKVWGWISSLFGKKPADTNTTTGAPATAEPFTPNAASTSAAGGGGSGTPFGAAPTAAASVAPSTPRPAAPASVTSVVAEEAERHFATQYVERRTVPRLLPTVWEVIKNFPKTLSIQVWSQAM
jgi:hypothetical protein